MGLAMADQVFEAPKTIIVSAYNPMVVPVVN